MTLGPGDAYVVPHGRPHQPYAATETTVLLFEPSETVNTGDTPASSRPRGGLLRVRWQHFDGGEVGAGLPRGPAQGPASSTRQPPGGWPVGS